MGIISSDYDLDTVATVSELIEFCNTDGRRIICPYCNNSTWMVSLDENNVTKDVNSPAAVFKTVSEKGTEVYYYVVTCTNCGTISMVNFYFVYKFLAEKKGIEGE